MSKKGVAIPIVLSSITILTFLLVNFTFFAELNFIKADNIIHKTQARLNARSGLHFAMSMLTLYQQARNLLEENESIKSFVKAEDIEKILYNPFQFPIDDSVVTNEIMKTALGDFNEILMVNGKITLNISPITGHLNPNHMRFSHYKKKEDNKKNKDEEKDLPANEEDETEGDKTKDSILFVENEILTILKKNLEKEKEKNEDFDTLYGNLDPEFLVKELKFYVMDPGQFTDPEQGELEGNYDPSEANAKHKPLLHTSELYLLKGWPDALIELVKNQLTVDNVTVIQVNKITDSQLRSLFPDITDDQVKQFFDYRDGVKKVNDPTVKEDIEGEPFESVEAFKDYITKTLGLLSPEKYDEKMKKLLQAGIRLGTAALFFKIESTGIMQGKTYTITAKIEIPLLEIPLETDKKNSDAAKNSNTNDSDISDEPSQSNNQDNNSQKDDTKKVKIEYLPPRIVDLVVGRE